MCQIKKSYYMPVAAAQTDDLRGELLPPLRRRFMVINHRGGEGRSGSGGGREWEESTDNRLSLLFLAHWRCCDPFGRKSLAVNASGKLWAKLKG